jgi:hypothetical protein
MKAKLHLALSVLVFAAGFGLLGAFTTLDRGRPLYYGVGIGAAFGAFIGAVLGGARGTWIDYAYGSPDRGRES